MGTKPEVSLEVTDSIRVDLPFPPSVNHYWRHTSRGHFKTLRAKQYGVLVKIAVSERLRVSGELSTPILGPIVVDITAYPPDRLRRDLDNLLKATLDALQCAGMYGDDHQVKEINMRWGAISKPGSLAVTLTPLDGSAGTIRLGKRTDRVI